MLGDWVQRDGPAEGIAPPDAMELLGGYYRLVAGEPPSWGDYRAAMQRDRRVILRLSVGRAGPDYSG